MARSKSPSLEDILHPVTQLNITSDPKNAKARSICVPRAKNSGMTTFLQRDIHAHLANFKLQMSENFLQEPSEGNCTFHNAARTLPPVVANVMHEEPAITHLTTCQGVAESKAPAPEEVHKVNETTELEPLPPLKPVSLTKRRLLKLRPAWLGRRNDRSPNASQQFQDSTAIHTKKGTFWKKLSIGRCPQDAPATTTTANSGPPLAPAGLSISIPEPNHGPPQKLDSPSERMLRAANHAFGSVRYFVSSCFTASYLWSPTASSENSGTGITPPQPTTWPETPSPNVATATPKTSILARIKSTFGQKQNVPKEERRSRRFLPWSRSPASSASSSQSAARVFNAPRVEELMDNVMEGLRVATGRKKKRGPKFVREMWKRATKWVKK